MYFRLKEFREKAELSQHDLAKMVGISQTHISDIENGKTTPTLFLAKRIANVFSVTLDEMISESLDEGIETTSFSLKGDDQVGRCNAGQAIFGATSSEGRT